MLPVVHGQLHIGGHFPRLWDCASQLRSLIEELEAAVNHEIQQLLSVLWTLGTDGPVWLLLVDLLFGWALAALGGRAGLQGMQEKGAGHWVEA